MSEVQVSPRELAPGAASARFRSRRFDSGRVAISGELDIAAVPGLDRVLRRAEARAELVVLDLRNLEFMDDSGARLLLAADRRIRGAGGRFVVVRGRADVMWFVELIGLDLELEFVDEPPDAPLSSAAAWRSGRAVPFRTREPPAFPQ